MAIAPGKKAPDFELASTSGAMFQLNSVFKDQACILIFVHNGIKSLDKKLLLEFKNQYAQFAASGVGLVAICRSDMEKLETFKKENELPFELLSDKYGETADAFKISNKMIHYTLRVSFFLDKDHKVKSIFPPKGTMKKQPELLEDSQVKENVDAFLESVISI